MRYILNMFYRVCDKMAYCQQKYFFNKKCSHFILIALESTDIYFVTLLYILQTICAGEFSGYSNYPKPYGLGRQLINGLQFLSRLKNHLCLAWDKFGALS